MFQFDSEICIGVQPPSVCGIRGYPSPRYASFFGPFTLILKACVLRRNVRMLMRRFSCPIAGRTPLVYTPFVIEVFRYAWERRRYSPYWPYQPSFAPQSSFVPVLQPSFVSVPPFTPALQSYPLQPLALRVPLARPVIVLSPPRAPTKSVLSIPTSPLPPEYRVEQCDVERDAQLREVLEKSHEELSEQGSRDSTDKALQPGKNPQGKSPSKSPQVKVKVAIKPTIPLISAKSAVIATTAIPRAAATPVAKSVTSTVNATPTTTTPTTSDTTQSEVSQTVVLHMSPKATTPDASAPVPENFVVTGDDKRRDEEIRSMLQRDPSSSLSPITEEALPSDRELQTQELEVIASIYGKESLTVSEQREYTYVIKVPREREDGPSFSLCFFFFLFFYVCLSCLQWNMWNFACSLHRPIPRDPRPISRCTLRGSP